MACCRYRVLRALAAQRRAALLRGGPQTSDMCGCVYRRRRQRRETVHAGSCVCCFTTCCAEFLFVCASVMLRERCHGPWTILLCAPRGAVVGCVMPMRETNTHAYERYVRAARPPTPQPARATMRATRRRHGAWAGRPPLGGNVCGAGHLWATRQGRRAARARTEKTLNFFFVGHSTPPKII